MSALLIAGINCTRRQGLVLLQVYSPSLYWCQALRQGDTVSPLATSLSLSPCLLMLHLKKANALHDAQSRSNWAPVTQQFLLTYPALRDFHNYTTWFHSATLRNLELGAKKLFVYDSHHTDWFSIRARFSLYTSSVRSSVQHMHTQMAVMVITAMAWNVGKLALSGRLSSYPPPVPGCPV